MKTWICRAALLTALCFWAMPVSVHAEDGYTLFAIEKGSDENIRNAYVVIDGKTGETESVAEEEASAGRIQMPGKHQVPGRIRLPEKRTMPGQPLMSGERQMPRITPQQAIFPSRRSSFSADPEWHSSLWAADQKNPKEKAPIQLTQASFFAIMRNNKYKPDEIYRKRG